MASPGTQARRDRTAIGKLILTASLPLRPSPFGATLARSTATFTTRENRALSPSCRLRGERHSQQCFKNCCQQARSDGRAHRGRVAAAACPGAPLRPCAGQGPRRNGKVAANEAKARERGCGRRIFPASVLPEKGPKMEPRKTARAAPLCGVMPLHRLDSLARDVWRAREWRERARKARCRRQVRFRALHRVSIAGADR